MTENKGIEYIQASERMELHTKKEKEKQKQETITHKNKSKANH